jgi:hypothetical protein
MMTLLLLSSIAFADPQIQVVNPGESVRAETLSYLLPEPMYDRCLLAVQDLDSCEETLTETQEQVDTFMVTLEELDDISALLDENSIQIQELTDLYVAEKERVAKLKYQRNVAIAVTVGFVAASATAIAVNQVVP